MNITRLFPQRLPAGKLLASTALICMLALAPSPATGEQAGGEDPNIHWQTGIARFQQGDFATALESFRRFFEAGNNPAVRFNIAVCHYNL